MLVKNLIASLCSIADDFKTGSLYKPNPEAIAVLRDAAFELKEHERTAKIVEKQWKGLVADTTYHPWCGGSYDALYERKETRYYCGDCGKQIDEDSHYCKYCGIKLKGKIVKG